MKGRGLQEVVSRRSLPSSAAIVKAAERAFLLATANTYCYKQTFYSKHTKRTSTMNVQISWYLLSRKKYFFKKARERERKERFIFLPTPDS